MFHHTYEVFQCSVLFSNYLLLLPRLLYNSRILWTNLNILVFCQAKLLQFTLKDEQKRVKFQNMSLFLLNIIVNFILTSQRLIYFILYFTLYMDKPRCKWQEYPRYKKQQECLLGIPAAIRIEDKDGKITNYIY